MRTGVGAILIAALASSQAISFVPQQKSPELSSVEAKLVSLGEQEYASWNHKSVAPLEGASDIVIHQWTTDDADVSVTIVRYNSDERAQKHIQQFAKDMKAGATFQDDSDEAYSLNVEGSSVAVRKRHFIVYIHVKTRSSSDKVRLLKQTNKLASKAIKG